LKLNGTLVAEHEHAWSEPDVLRRCAELVDRIATLWPRPAYAMRPPRQSAPLPARDLALELADEVGQDSTQGAHAGKYEALSRWLRQQPGTDITLTFGQVEQILDGPLPPSARKHLTHWYAYDGSALGRAIRDASWKATHVQLTDELVTFIYSPQYPDTENLGRDAPEHAPNLLILDDEDPMWDQHAGLEGHRRKPEWTADDQQDVRTFYENVRGKGKIFLDILIDHPGHVLSVDELCALSKGNFTGSHSVAGAVSGLYRAYDSSEHRYPFYWWSGNPTTYAMKPIVAALFDHARTLLGGC
jgi:hypothetical protein